MPPNNGYKPNDFGAPRAPTPGAYSRSGGAPISRDEAVRGLAMCIVLSLVTCGFYMLYWQYLQFKAVNAWLGREEHSFLSVFLLTIVTCGIYGLYYEYKFATSVQEVQSTRGMRLDPNLPVVVLLVAVFVTPIVSRAILQTEINRWYGE